MCPWSVLSGMVSTSWGVLVGVCVWDLAVAQTLRGPLHLLAAIPACTSHPPHYRPGLPVEHADALTRPARRLLSRRPDGFAVSCAGTTVPKHLQCPQLTEQTREVGGCHMWLLGMQTCRSCEPENGELSSTWAAQPAGVACVCVQHVCDNCIAVHMCQGLAQRLPVWPGLPCPVYCSVCWLLVQTKAQQPWVACACGEPACLCGSQPCWGLLTIGVICLPLHEGGVAGCQPVCRLLYTAGASAPRFCP